MAFTKSRAEVESWVTSFYETADNKLSGYALQKFLAKDIALTFGNYDAVVGEENAVQFFNSVYDTLQGLKHDFATFDLIKNRLYLPFSKVAYEIKGDPEGKKIKLPALAVYELVEGGGEGKESILIQKFQVYIDSGPLRERGREVADLLKK